MGALAYARLASPLALHLAACGAASAQNASDYKALVCVFLQGGNDTYNTVLRTDSGSWERYVHARSADPASLVLGQPGTSSGVLPLPGWEAALHPRLSRIQDLFTQRRLAVVSNVGPLLEPLTKAEYLDKSKPLPSKLFSHNDQQSTWLSMAPEGASEGWGGRMADMLLDGNGGSMFTAISASGNTVWLSGKTVRQYQVANAGAIRMGSTLDANGIERIYNVPQMAAALRRVATDPQATHVMERDLAAVAARSLSAEQVLSKALPNATSQPYAGLPVGNALARQLQIVARCIQAQHSLGLKRQVFFVNLWGFDTHDNQNTAHANALGTLDQALGYFDGVMQAMGMSQQVTTFTASDFGRTLTSNGDGTDHGWGAHHFVLGGAVNGGRVVGTLPTYGIKQASGNAFDDTPDQLHNGILLPRLSVEQLGASLGMWFGLTSGQLLDVFPRLARFDPSRAMGDLFIS